MFQYSHFGLSEILIQDLLVAIRSIMPGCISFKCYVCRILYYSDKESDQVLFVTVHRNVVIDVVQRLIPVPFNFSAHPSVQVFP
jgi:hypothetical protein